MGKDSLVSVIVPVYNVKEYLRECFDSITSQSYANLEIILVDDGSTDSSGELCDELAARDGRAFVLHKSNGGLSDARNAGLRVAHGNWVSFVDSDDYVSPVFIEALLDAALSAGCQISAIPFGKTFEDNDDCSLINTLDLVPSAKAFASQNVQQMMLYQKLDTGAPWRLYAKEILDDDPFPIGLYYEDLASVYRIIHAVDRVAVVDCVELYAYRMRDNSIIRQEYKHIKGESALRVSRQLYSDICAWYPDLADAAASRCFSICRMVFAQAPMGTKATPEEHADATALWDNLRRYRKIVLRDRSARKRERFAAAVACLGRTCFEAFCQFSRKVGLMR